MLYSSATRSQICWDHLHSWDGFLTALMGLSDWDCSGHQYSASDCTVIGDLAFRLNMMGNCGQNCRIFGQKLSENCGIFGFLVKADNFSRLLVLAKPLKALLIIHQQTSSIFGPRCTLGHWVSQGHYLFVANCQQHVWEDPA